ncbi:MAG: hypothetical protein U0M06_07495 [Clostridia bacterium]|nr:hypothetical protein [Clostridia bacterium]
MEEKVIKCLETVGQAIKVLITSANNEAEVIGLMTLFAAGFQETYDKVVEEAINEIEEKKEEKSANGIIQ